MSITVEHVSVPTDAARLLVCELDAELAGPYPPEQRHGLSLDRIFQAGILFFVASLDGNPVGCGGIAMDEGFVELKRMYVRPAARGSGVATAILRRLEAEAKRHHVPRLTLETGDERHAAMRFYEREGFTRCGAFGVYATMRREKVARSVFFENQFDAAISLPAVGCKNPCGKCLTRVRAMERMCLAFLGWGRMGLGSSVSCLFSTSGSP